ncbi:hypothetical protein [Bacillus sp. UMB0728]|uniref:hypothetical protein n=1 Tax=Bacillus sp. UMB0728 TaxID=2066052 RepID=UPI00115A6B94|nr:hypothetical protein [Bacillus sp. UMB0728]
MENFDNIIRGMRIFKQDGEKSRYALIPEKAIFKYAFLNMDIAIRKGDLLTPHKWEYHKKTLIREELFSFDDYEYIFYPDKWTSELLNKALEPFLPSNLEKGESLDYLQQLEKIPAEAERSVREIIEQEMIPPEGVMITEAYVYKHHNQSRSLILSEDVYGDDITGEETNRFQQLKLQEVYQNASSAQYLYKLKSKDDHNDSFIFNKGDWYIFYTDESGTFSWMEELFDIDDLLPFTNFS